MPLLAILTAKAAAACATPLCACKILTLPDRSKLINIGVVFMTNPPLAASITSICCWRACFARGEFPGQQMIGCIPVSRNARDRDKICRSVPANASESVINIGRNSFEFISRIIRSFLIVSFDRLCGDLYNRLSPQAVIYLIGSH